MKNSHVLLGFHSVRAREREPEARHGGTQVGRTKKKKKHVENKDGLIIYNLVHLGREKKMWKRGAKTFKVLACLACIKQTDGL